MDVELAELVYLATVYLDLCLIEHVVAERELAEPAVEGELSGSLRFLRVIEYGVELQAMIILSKRCDRADEVVQVVAVVVEQEREHFALGFDLCEALGKSALDYDIAIAVRLPCPCGGIPGDRPVFRLQLYGLFLQVHVGSAFLFQSLIVISSTHWQFATSSTSRLSMSPGHIAPLENG